MKHINSRNLIAQEDDYSFYLEIENKELSILIVNEKTQEKSKKVLQKVENICYTFLSEQIIKEAIEESKK